MRYLEETLVSRTETPQSRPIPGSAQVANSAGGYSFAVDDWGRLERFLILGSEGGSYYAKERDLTKENIDAVKRCIATDGLRTVRTITEVSVSGRAPKNDPALYALALCASYGGDVKVRQAALDGLPRVARIGTHLLHFAAFVDKMRGWGPSLRKAVADWYLQKPIDSLAYQVLKYQQRDGWSHRDLLRLAHPNPPTDEARALFNWVAPSEKRPALPERLPALIQAFDQAKAADEATLIRLIREHGLTREMIPTEHQKSPKIWEALLESMPLTAMIRTLGRMGACGLVAPMSDAAALVVARLSDQERIRKSRVHPIHVLTALLTYKNGRGTKGSLTWPVVPQVIDALDAAFYLAFANVTPTGKRFYLGLDVSGSMGMGAVAGVEGLTPRVASGAMAMATARVESQYFVAGFQGQMLPLDISARDRLDSVCTKISDLRFGSTDCALPMLDALSRKMPVDAFVVYTDSETWAGNIHPTQALKKYRDAMGIPAKLIVVGMVSNGFTIADPSDAGMLDIVGFDSATPQVISAFAGGQAMAAEDE